MAAPSKHILGIDPRMYRHFAVLTLVISLSVAFFANGEQKRALEGDRAQPAQSGTRGSHQPSEPGAAGGVPLNRPQLWSTAPMSPPPPAAGDEQPTIIAPDEDDDSQFRPARHTYSRPKLRPDPAYLAKLTPEQRKGYLRAFALREQQEAASAQGGGADQSGPTQQQINRMAAESRARSGG